MRPLRQTASLFLLVGITACTETGLEPPGPEPAIPAPTYVELSVGTLAEAAGGPIGPILDAAELAVSLRRSRAGHLQRLRTELPGTELLYVPYLFQRSHGVRATHRIAGHLGEELGY